MKAIYHAKTGEFPTIQFMDRLEITITNQGRTFADYLELLQPHLGNTWKNPGGFLTHKAQTGFRTSITVPQEKPKPKCPACKSDNQRGAVLENGAIVACPICSTPEWREELAAKDQDQRWKAAKTKLATG